MRPGQGCTLGGDAAAAEPDVAPAQDAPAGEPSWAGWSGLLEACADMLVVVRGSVVLWISPAVESVLGWSPTEVIGRPFAQLRHPDDPKPQLGDLPELGGPAKTLPRARYLCRNGSYRWLQSRMVAQRAPDGTEVLVASVRDVGDQVEAEDAIRHAHSRVQALLDASPDGLASYQVRRDSRGDAVGFTLESWNSAAAASNTGAVEPAVGMDFDQLVPDGHRNGFRGLLCRTADRGTLQRLRTVLERPGLRRTLDAVGVPIGDTHVLVTWRDVTEQAISEQLIVNAYMHAQAAWDTLHVALDSVPEPVIIVETDSPSWVREATSRDGHSHEPLRLVFVNTAAVGDREFAPDDLLDHDFAEIYPNHADELHTAIAGIRSDGQPRLVIMKSRATTDGRVNYYETSISPAPPHRYIIIGRNITPPGPPATREPPLTL